MPKQDNSSSEQKAYKAYSRILTAVIKMAVALLLFVLLGQYIDEKLLTETPWFTIIGSLIGVSVSLYLGLKDFLRNDN